MNDPMAPPVSAASIASTSQNMQVQQTQLMNQMNQMINTANLSCGPGTDCYNQQQIADALDAYNAAVITEQTAPKTVDTAFKNYLVAAKGQNGANQALLDQYTQNGLTEKAKKTQQFDAWFNDMTQKISTRAQYDKTTRTLRENITLATNAIKRVNINNDDATNDLNLLERKIHYTAQQVSAINGAEYYIKLVYWLAFMTWGFCVIYERAFTMKTAGLFILFTVIILTQDWIMDGIIYCIKAIIPNNTYLTW
jgi:hypothetical protein